jgi:hypothetical protein
VRTPARANANAILPYLKRLFNSFVNLRFLGGV